MKVVPARGNLEFQYASDKTTEFSIYVLSNNGRKRNILYIVSFATKNLKIQHYHFSIGANVQLNIIR